MKKMLCALLVLALCLPLAGCTANGPSTSLPVVTSIAPEPTAEAPAVQEPPTQEPTAQPSITQYTDLSFLNEEQKAAYQLALELYPYMTYNTEAWPMAAGNDTRPQLDPEEYPYYYPGGGGMELWKDFLLHWTRAFTPRYLTAMLEERPYFIEYEGYTWFMAGAASGPWPYTTEYYEIGMERDDLISFYARRITEGHDGETYLDYDEVRLVQTIDGEWRCDYLSLIGPY